MKKTIYVLLVVGAILAAAAPAHSAGGYEILHEFAGGADDGSAAHGSLTLESAKLFGMTGYGGDADYGTVFSMDIDGGSFSLLHEFGGGPDDGRLPRDLTLDSGKLYGTTGLGGNANLGTVFSMDTDGSNFTLLHEFGGSPTDGKYPYTRLTLDSGKLYGVTESGGGSPSEVGTVFSMDTQGNNYTVLHNFNGGSADGNGPRGNLILNSGRIYGVTRLGGDTDRGTIFSMDTDGSNFSLLHEFAGGPDDGRGPRYGLVLDSDKLYGMTELGGEVDRGTIFSIDTDGTNFALLYEFAGGSDDGAQPFFNLTLDSGKLYGMTRNGGDTDYGTIFSIETDGSNFTLLHEFAGGSDDGRDPYSGLTLYLGKLYGMTRKGGDADYGTVFVIPEPATLGLLLIGGLILFRRRT